MKRKMFFIGTMALMVASSIFWSCQKDDFEIDSENGLMLKSAQIAELNLTYPDEVFVDNDFNIAFSSTCGKLKIERGYLPVIDEETGKEIGRKYNNLSCETDNLEWEAIVDGGFSKCSGGIHVENWSDIGTYVYRATLNQQAINDSNKKSNISQSCSDCADFNGNKTECFVVNVIPDGCEESFTYKTNDDLTVIFTYRSDVKIDGAEVKFTCPQITGYTSNDGKTYTVNNTGNQTVLSWIGSIEACTSITFNLTFNPDCIYNENSKKWNTPNIWTDFKVNEVSKKTVTPPLVGASCETIEEAEVCSWPIIKYTGCN
jgi:hypothetical protein